jgi:hypothetical protein
MFFFLLIQAAKKNKNEGIIFCMLFLVNIYLIVLYNSKLVIIVDIIVATQIMVDILNSSTHNFWKNHSKNH